MPRPLPRTLLLCAAVLCLLLAGRAEQSHAPAEYTLREWHTSDDLPSDEVNSILQDEQGYLWVATTSGIVRFDGTAFSPVATPPKAFTRSMAYLAPGRADSIAGLLALHDAEPTAVSRSSGEQAGFYVRTGNAFQFIAEPSLNGKTVRSVFSHADGSIWFGCDDGTIVRRLGTTSNVFPAPPGPSGRRIPSFATDAMGQLWTSIGSTVVRFDGKSWIPVPLDFETQEVRVCSSRTGGPWLFNREKVLKWNGTAFEPVVDLPELVGAHFIQAALEDSYGCLWLGTRSQGLYRVRDGYLLPIPTSHEDIIALQEDNEGGIWVGTNGGGLNRLRPRIHKLFDRTSGLIDNFSYTITEDSKGTIWFANRDGGVARVVGGEVDPISRRMNWRQFSAMSVYPAPGGGVWVTSGIGVFRTDAANPEKLLRVTSLNNFKIIRATFTARNGDYWMAVDPDRVARWRDDRITVFGTSEGFSGREVRGIAEDATGAIWIGAADGQLFRMRDNRFERITLPGSDRLGALQVLYFDTDGTLYIGTTRQGIVVMPGGDPARAKLVGTEQGLPNDNVTEILADDFARFWIATRGGIFWLHRSQLRDVVEGKADRIHAIVLGREQGVPDLSCLGLFQPSAWKARDGCLWFATRRGVIRIDPALTAGAKRLAPVTLSGIRCEGREQPATGSLTIRSSVRKTELHLSVLDLSSPEQILLKYKLEGFDDDWVPLKVGREVAYPRLPPGKYVFRAMASNGNGTWNEQPELLTLFVNPPPWQSWWANLIYLLALIAIITVLVRLWSHRRLRMKLERLEREKAIERERTRIAQNIHDDLGASLTRISLLTQAAVHDDPAHADRFEKIYEAANAITRSMDEIVWAVNPKCDDIESLVYYVGNFAQGFLGAAGVRCRLELPKSAPAVRLTSQLRHNLFLCCKEALNNVVRHARASEAVITINASPALLEIIISDNGRGVAASASALPASVSPWRAGGGNGLKNMRQRMSDVGGTCSFADRPEGGTTATFAVAFPPPAP